MHAFVTIVTGVRRRAGCVENLNMVGTDTYSSEHEALAQVRQDFARKFPEHYVDKANACPVARATLAAMLNVVDGKPGREIN